MENGKKGNKGPKYYLDIEKKIVEWHENTITTEQIIEIGGWDPKQGAIVVDNKTGKERTLSPGEVIELKPGIGFSKKVLYKRG